MSNELVELKFQAEFQPNEIKIINEDKLASLVEQTAKKYEVMIFTDENIKEAKEARSDLNKSAKQIEEARKKVKNDFTKPLDKFEEKMNNYSSRIKEVSTTIDSQIKNYEEEQKKQRLVTIQGLINSEADKAGVDPQGIQFNNSWLNGGSFTPKGNPVKKVVEEIQNAIQKVVNEINRIENEKLTVANFCETAEVDATPYLAMVERDIPSEEIIETIKQAVERKRLSEIKQAEEVKRAEEQRNEQETLAEQVNREYQKQLASKPIYQESATPLREDEKYQLTEEIMEFTLHIKGSKRNLYALNKFMKDNGIEFKKVGDE